MTRTLWITVMSVLSACGMPAMAQDPVDVDPRHYQVEFENEHVRILRITYGPHEKSVRHYHPASVAIFLTDARVRFTQPDGTTLDVSAQAGTALYNEARHHLPENASDQPLELIEVELKSAPAAAE